MADPLRIDFERWLPDEGELGNQGYLEVLNVLPVGLKAWIPDAPITEKVALADTDIRGVAVHPSHGTDYKVYYGTDDELREVDVDVDGSWAENDRSGATYTPDNVTGWQMTPYGKAMVAVGGHSQLPQMRVSDTGNFEDLITNPQPFPEGWVQCWVEDNSAGTYEDVTTEFNDYTSAAECFPATPALNDAVLFGKGLSIADGLSIKVETGAAGIHSGTWQYWNGAWTNLASVVDGTNGLRNTGVNSVTYTVPTDSVAVAINGSPELHWIKYEITAFTTVTVTPTIFQAGEHTSWPPKAKFCARWGNSLALGNIQDVGAATAHQVSNADPRLILISDETGRIFGTYDSHPGLRTTFKYLPSDGEITCMVGGEEFGAVMTETEVFRVRYGGPFRHDIQKVEANLGTIFPNAWAWLNKHQLVFMSTAGPAIMDEGGVRPLGADEYQRTLFDPTWVTTTYNINATQAKRFLFYCAYRPKTGIACWWYRKTDDAPDIQLNINVKNGRASISIPTTAPGGGSNFNSHVHGAATIPTTPGDFEGGVVLVGDRITGNHALYECSSAGNQIWYGDPTFTTGYLERGVNRWGVLYIRPRFTRNLGAASIPTLTATVNPKDDPGVAANSSDQVTTTTREEEGEMNLQGREAYFNQIQLVFDAVNIDKIAEIEGFDVFYSLGGGTK